jgi:hypothetical protein
MHPVVALVPATARRRVQSAQAGGPGVRFIESFGEVKRYLAERREATNVIVDPELLSAEDVGELAWLRGRRQFSVLALASVGVAGVTAVIRLSLRCDCDVLFIEADDVSLLMQVWLGRARRDISVPSRVLRRILDVCEALPDELCAPCMGIFGGLPIPTDVGGLLERTGMQRRTADRHARAAGLAGLARVLRGARVARATEMFTRGSGAAPLPEVASAVGLPTVRALSDACLRVTGTRRVRLSTGHDAAAVVAKIVGYVTDANGARPSPAE